MMKARRMYKCSKRYKYPYLRTFPACGPYLLVSLLPQPGSHVADRSLRSASPLIFLPSFASPCKTEVTRAFRRDGYLAE